ncbi:MAG: hypothetical protein ACK500_06155 [Flavobacteriales bacterium]|jgi:hypothetical protein
MKPFTSGQGVCYRGEEFIFVEFIGRTHAAIEREQVRTIADAKYVYGIVTAERFYHDMECMRALFDQQDPALTGMDLSSLIVNDPPNKYRFNKEYSLLPEGLCNLLDEYAATYAIPFEVIESAYKQKEIDN